MASASKKRGQLNDQEKLYIAEHFLKDTIENISQELNRTSLAVTNYIAKLKHTTKEDLQKQEEQQKESLLPKPKPKSVMDSKNAATQMTQESSSIPFRTKKYQSPFKT